VDYLRAIWSARHFWTHLARADLRSKWRRSFFGIAWTVIQPLGMTLLIAAVFGRIFATALGDYAPYILSGIIVWDFVNATMMGGALAFVQADAYIKQYRHPLAIYTLRAVLTNLVVLALASIALLIWVVVALPHRLGLHTLAALSIFPVLLMIGWPLATLLAYIATRFRDLPYALTLALQAVWFVSPVYFEARVFRDARLDWLVDWNPVYHVLQILRAPLLQGKWPSSVDYAFALGTACVAAILAYAVGLRAERRVIFYL
jgi:homopolymeric O-antigen transport system permease protein